MSTLQAKKDQLALLQTLLSSAEKNIAIIRSTKNSSMDVELCQFCNSKETIYRNDVGHLKLQITETERNIQRLTPLPPPLVPVLKPIQKSHANRSVVATEIRVQQ